MVALTNAQLRARLRKLAGPFSRVYLPKGVTAEKASRDQLVKAIKRASVALGLGVSVGAALVTASGVAVAVKRSKKPAKSLGVASKFGIGHEVHKESRLLQYIHGV